MNSLEIKERVAILTSNCKDILARCRAEYREMTEDENAEFQKTKEEIIALKKQLADLEEKLKSYEVEDVELEKEDEVMGASCEDKDELNKRYKNNNISTNMKKKQFSLLRAINDVVNNRSFDAETQSVIDAARKEMRGTTFSGQIQIPFTRAAITVDANGADTVGVEVFDFEKPLRAKNILFNAGAKWLTGLHGDVQIPVMGGSSCYWEGEVDAAQDGGITFTSVKLSAKRLSAQLLISKQYLMQTSESAEAILREDLVNAISAKLEQTILGNGAGDANTPKGMFNGKVFSAATDTFGKLTALEAEVEDANVLNPITYVCSNKAKAAFRSMAKSTKNTQLVMEGGEIDGTPVYSSSNVIDNGFIVGDFSNLVIAQFGNGIDLVVDPYSKASEGCIKIIVNAYFDAKVLRESAFAYGKTAI